MLGQVPEAELVTIAAILSGNQPVLPPVSCHMYICVSISVLHVTRDLL